MMTSETREAKREGWLRHWRDWSASAGGFADYARRHDLDCDEGYRWKRILQRAGLLPAELRAFNGAESPVVEAKPAVRFARVRIDPARQTEPAIALRLQLQLTNGRRAELVLSDERQLPRVLQLLEQSS
jgi:hypothetical protein